MNQKLKILLILLLLGSYASGQIGQLTGVVTDSQGETLPGVNVIVDGTTTGVITNIDGAYSIKVEKGQTLIYSFIGYQTQTVTYEGQSTINIVLESDDISIDEVVIVGYGTQKKESIVGSISQAKGEDIKRQGSVTNLSDALSGSMPGVTVLTKTGVPGGGGSFNNDNYDATAILVRGTTTWNNASPLVLVDGVERNMNDIELNDVETFSVLKDASATAVFGVKGANGVILITTKRGEVGKPRLTVEANTTFKRPSKIPRTLSAYEGIKARNYAVLGDLPTDNTWSEWYVPDEILEHYRTQEYPYAYADQNWDDVMFKNWGRSHKVNMNVSGGTGFVKYFSSFGYTRDGDILNTEDVGQGYNPEFKYDRFNFRTNLDFNLTKSTTFSVNLSGYMGQAQRSGAAVWDLWDSFWDRPKDNPIYLYPDGVYGHGNNLYDRKSENTYYNLNFDGLERETRTEINSDFNLNQKLDFITKGLSIGAKLAFDNFSKTKGPNIGDEGLKRKYVDPTYYITPNADIEDYTLWQLPDGHANLTHGFDYYPSPLNYSNEQIDGGMINATRRMLYYQTSINYARKFGLHDFTALALFSREEMFKYSGSFAGFPEKREDWVSRITYGYDNRYFIDLNGAYNGSEKFGPENKFEFFPSLAVGWTMSNEAFFQNFVDVVNKVRFRYSNGKVGNDKVGGNMPPWLWATIWEAQTGNNSSWPFGDPSVNGPSYYNEGVPGNPDIRWETAQKQNFGIELGFLDNMFLFTADLFNENRYDILVAAANRTVPEWFGQTPSPANIGEVYSEGVELEGEFRKAHKNGLSYWAKAYWAYSYNQINYKEDPALRPAYRKSEGYAIGQTRSQISTSIISSWDDLYTGVMPLNNPGKLTPGDYRLLDFNADGIIDENDNVPYAYPEYPLNNYSFSFGADYKGFSMSLMFEGAYNVTQEMQMPYFAFRAASVLDQYYYDTYTPEVGNTDAEMMAFALMRPQSWGHYNRMDGSMLRLRSAEIAYSLPKKFTSRFGVANMRVYANGNNIFTWSKLPIDIEGRNHNDRNYPLQKQYTIGLNVTF